MTYHNKYKFCLWLLLFLLISSPPNGNVSAKVKKKGFLSKFRPKSSESEEDGPIWTRRESCKKGEYIIGMSLQLSAGGEREVAGLKLLCGPPDNQRNVQTQLGHYSQAGFWTTNYFCPLATGYQVLMNPPGQKRSGSEESLSNVKLICSNFNETIFPEIGEYRKDSHAWSLPFECKKGEALCSLRSKIARSEGVESSASSEEGSKFPNLKYLGAEIGCCKILRPEEACTPWDKWDVIFEYDNSMGLHPAQYSYIRRLGVTKTIGETKIDQKHDLYNLILNPHIEGYQKQGVEATSIQSLKGTFRANLGHSKKTSFEWHRASSDTWQNERSTSIGLQIDPGYRLRVYQIVGFCGDFQVRPDWIYQNGTYVETRRRGIIDSTGKRRMRFGWKVGLGILYSAILVAYNFFGYFV